MIPAPDALLYLPGRLAVFAAAANLVRHVASSDHTRVVQGSAFGIIKRVHDDVARIFNGKNPVMEVLSRSFQLMQRTCKSDLTAQAAR